MNFIKQYSKTNLFYLLCSIYVFIVGLALIKEAYWILLLPFIGIIALLFIYRLDYILLLIAFATPLAVNLADKDFNIGLSLPTEPLMIIATLLFFAKLILEGGYDKRILHHPITVTIIFNLIWIGITSISSTLPIISFKFLASRLWFVTSFYFLGLLLFKQWYNIGRFIWAYSIALLIVVIYTISQHSTHGFDEETAHWVMSPFFNDHTSYGAILAMFFPITIALIINRDSSLFAKGMASVATLIFLLAIILSYTRATWVSLAGALVLLIIMLFKVKLKYLFSLLGLIIVFFILNQNQYLSKLEKNRQDSSNNLQEHIESISNISSDASNLERLNRWSCAMRMFSEKPFLGWGPGTYSFQYAPFQQAKDRTIISTNSGDGGNAHSEYLGPLAESGFMGTISFLSIIITTIIVAFRVIYTHPQKYVRQIVIALFLGWVTYILHGFLNNFLDTDKASVPFWGFMAIIVAIDIFHTPNK